MLERLRQHPVIYAIGLALFFLFWVFPPWLATIWPLWSQEPFPNWLSRKGWSGLSPYLSAVLLAVSTASVLGLLGAILHAVRQHRREVRWLEDIADNDSQFMEQRVIVDHYSKRVVPHLDALSPYVILQVFVWNTSVYTLTLEEKVEGPITFRGEPLPDEARSYPAKNQTRLVRINHGGNEQLELHQTIPLPIVEYIKSGEPLEVGQAAIWFTYQFRPNFTRRVRISLGNAPFVVKK